MISSIGVYQIKHLAEKDMSPLATIKMSCSLCCGDVASYVGGSYGF